MGHGFGKGGVDEEGGDGPCAVVYFCRAGAVRRLILSQDGKLEDVI